MDFKEELKKQQQLINSELEKIINKENCPEKILNEAMEYSLLAGGKRLRPILMLESYKVFRDDIEKCMTYACAIELIHSFSLIQDDLPAIDDDDFRHGKQTNHKKFNEATAILASDGLWNWAYKIICDDLVKSNPDELPVKLRALRELPQAIDRMIAGEYVDTEYEGKEILSEYLEYMHKNKTGALIRAAVKIGAILAKADDENIAKLDKYADIIGLTFQIKDDILSVEGDEKILGKPVGNDEKKNKCTYVSKYGLDKAKQMLEELTNEAVKITEEYGEKGEFLKELAIYIKERNK